MNLFRSNGAEEQKAFLSGWSDLLHPWRYVTGALGTSVLAGGIKRIVSRRLYEYSVGRIHKQSGRR